MRSKYLAIIGAVGIVLCGCAAQNQISASASTTQPAGRSVIYTKPPTNALGRLFGFFPFYIDKCGPCDREVPPTTVRDFFSGTPERIEVIPGTRWFASSGTGGPHHSGRSVCWFGLEMVAGHEYRPIARTWEFDCGFGPGPVCSITFADIAPDGAETEKTVACGEFPH
jgi:hypothetical protein